MQYLLLASINTRSPNNHILYFLYTLTALCMAPWHLSSIHYQCLVFVFHSNRLYAFLGYIQNIKLKNIKWNTALSLHSGDAMSWEQVTSVLSIGETGCCRLWIFHSFGGYYLLVLQGRRSLRFSADLLSSQNSSLSYNMAYSFILL